VPPEDSNWHPNSVKLLAAGAAPQTLPENQSYRPIDNTPSIRGTLLLYGHMRLGPRWGRTGEESIDEERDRGRGRDGGGGGAKGGLGLSPPKPKILATSLATITRFGLYT